MRQIAARVCWFVYALAVVLCMAQIGLDAGLTAGAFFGSALGMATIAIFIAGVALCAIWDS